MSWTAQGLPPGYPYKYTVTPLGPGGIGPTATSSSFNAVALPGQPTTKPTPPQQPTTKPVPL